MNMQKKI